MIRKDYSKYNFAKIYDDKEIHLYKKLPKNFSYDIYEDVKIGFNQDGSLVLTAREIHYTYTERDNPRQSTANETYHESEIKLGTRRKYILFGKKLPFYYFTINSRQKRTKKQSWYYLHTNRYKIIIGDEKE